MSLIHVPADAVRAGDIPKAKADGLCVIGSVWLDPGVLTAKVDLPILFDTHRAATSKAIRKAMRHEPGIDWLPANQDQVTRCFHQMALEREG